MPLEQRDSPSTLRSWCCSKSEALLKGVLLGHGWAVIYLGMQWFVVWFVLVFFGSGRILVTSSQPGVVSCFRHLLSAYLHYLPHCLSVHIFSLLVCLSSHRFVHLNHLTAVVPLIRTILAAIDPHFRDLIRGDSGFKRESGVYRLKSAPAPDYFCHTRLPLDTKDTCAYIFMMLVSSVSLRLDSL